MELVYILVLKVMSMLKREGYFQHYFSFGWKAKSTELHLTACDEVKVVFDIQIYASEGSCIECPHQA